MLEIVTAHGVDIPAIGLGTWQLRGQECVRGVADAISVGYRHIDTAGGMGYENEEAVGEGIRVAGIPREALFVTTKVAQENLADGTFQRSVESSLRRLSLDYIDLVLIHSPSLTLSVANTVQPLNDVKRRGFTRHIGVSNFPVALLAEAWDASEAPIVANQCEYHPYLNQDAVLTACRERGTAFVAHCPIGRRIAFDDPVIANVAMRKGRTPAQVILRWHVEQGSIPIPKSSHAERIRENFNIFDFSLTADENRAISALTRSHHQRICAFRDIAPKWDA